MLVILSPAKTLDFDANFATPPVTEPTFFEDSVELIKSLNSMTKTEIANLLKISDSLAELNFIRYKNFALSFANSQSKPAITSFRGDVYKAFERENFSQEDYQFLQQHLRILSGLYGILKPLDGIQPYRLEMGTPLINSRGKNLYSFWKNKVTQSLADTLAQDTFPVLINLASKEYFSVVEPKNLGFPIITITFKEEREGKLKVIPIQAKRARGVMANWIVKNRIDSPQKLFNFAENKYKYQPEISSDSEYVFIR